MMIDNLKIILGASHMNMGAYFSLFDHLLHKNQVKETRRIEKKIHFQ